MAKLSKSVGFLPQFAAVVSAVFLLACEGAPDSEAMGRDRFGPVPVVTSIVSAQRYTDSFAALGSVRATEAVEIRARISSAVTKIHFREGQAVERGALLVELDDREIAAELAMAQAALEKVRSQYERSRSLRETRVVSEAELDELAADVRKAEADVAAVNVRLGHCSVTAPISGVIGLRHVSPGALVGTDTMITTLDDIRSVRLDFSIPETFLAVVRPGMTVAAQTAVYPDQAFDGLVSTIDTRIDPVTRSVTVVAELANGDSLLKPGMFMTVELQRSRDAVLLIPEQALAPRAGRQFVFVIRDGKAYEVEVALGIRAPGQVEVTAGLQSGDEVIVEGTQKVRDGDAVTTQLAPAVPG